ncbi:TetR/AcrR family transcriptional regulator [Streptomyces sp. TBY4]|uniref:TetR/AcrR family transcriptional regulator n=1 Tax=Streptomyces sp. TBY4 TaxID=2962030 RepID=UPI0020B83252|nr:TetR/AcrR family transcriptional regulator [Streptomyces sp. TBY4]MCP3756997.1 TetR/AcrR family transcriptional regulator [Streptomyces sp. TBY4]
MASDKRSRGSAARAGLLRAAAQELAATGHLEVAAVAHRAGVSVGLPYRYFGTRSGLLIAVAEDFHQRLCQASALRTYDAPTWAARERSRVRDWIAFLYAEPLAPLMLAGPVGDGEVAAAHTRLLSRLVDLGAANIAHGQATGELEPDRDPELTAAGVLGGIHAMATVALARTPTPPADLVTDQVWAFTRRAVGLRDRKD